MIFLKLLNLLPNKERKSLAAEGRAVRARIEALGTPRIWGTVPLDLLQDLRAWQKKCADAGLSSASVYDKMGNDTEHVSGAEALLIADEIILALDPPGSIGG